MLTTYGFLFLNIGLAALMVHAVLRPVGQALAGRPFRWRAQAVDGLTLALLLLLPLALFVWQQENVKSPLRWQTLSLGSFVIFAWWRSVGALTQLEIRGPVRRAVFTGVILPLALFGSVALVVGVMRLRMELALRSSRSTADLIWLILAPLYVVYVFGIRRLTRWVLAGAVPIGTEDGKEVILAETAAAPRPAEPVPK